MSSGLAAGNCLWNASSAVRERSSWSTWCWLNRPATTRRGRVGDVPWGGRPTCCRGATHAQPRGAGDAAAARLEVADDDLDKQRLGDV